MKNFKWTYFLIIPASAVVMTLLWNWLELVDIEGREMTMTFAVGIVNTTVIWLGCMAIVGILWKKYPWEQKPLTHLLIEIPTIILYTIIVGYALYKYQIYLGIIKEGSVNLLADASVSILITLLITTLHEAYFFYKQWKLNFSKSVKLEKDNINAKYEALKAQINPHFLFNSLNSLVSIIDGNEKAVSYIMDLSDFLRYMLKSREREVVLLREETQVLAKYVNLQKTRFGNNLSIHLDINEKYYHYALPPLVLQMLVENCIKHNIISKEMPLNVLVQAKDGFIKVENNLQSKDEVASTGNGLHNISERYAYLTTKKVEINQTNDKFTVTLPLVLVDL